MMIYNFYLTTFIVAFDSKDKNLLNKRKKKEMHSYCLVS